jgi:hypothetical protein
MSMPASTKGGGVANAFPDVCKTPAPPAPPIPIPYPNIAQLTMASKVSTKVKIVGKEAVTTKSEIPSSNGDEAGVAGGVKSSKNMDKTTFTKGSGKVKVEGEPLVHVTSQTQQNGASANGPGTVVAPSQPKVLVTP